MIMNQKPTVDVRKIMSGKDCGFFDENGNLMATVESGQSQANITNAKFQPLGSAQEMSRMTSVSITLKITELIIESSKFVRDILNGIKDGAMPAYTFQGVLHNPYNDSEERVVYRQCVPDGTIDIQNMQQGDLLKRELNFIVNQVPEMQSVMRTSD